jgi:hypothetical protein
LLARASHRWRQRNIEGNAKAAIPQQIDAIIARFTHENWLLSEELGQNIILSEEQLRERIKKALEQCYQSGERDCRYYNNHTPAMSHH